MMNRSELKKTLFEQHEALDRAVLNKLAELQNDSDLNDESDIQSDDFDSSLVSAFNHSEADTIQPSYNDAEITNTFDYYSKSGTQPRYIGEAPTEQSIQQHKENISAKIAALRGLSLPGEYLKK